MKPYQWLTACTCMIIFIGCKKQATPSTNLDETAQAKSFFESSILPGARANQAAAIAAGKIDPKDPRLSLFREPVWERATTVQISRNREAVVVPLHYKTPFPINSNFNDSSYNIDDIAHLLIYKDQLGKDHVEMITFFPDNNSRNTRSFTGILIVEDWYGNPLNRYKYEPGGVIKKYVVGAGAQQSSNIGADNANTPQTDAIIEVCYQISGYNYSIDDPDNGYSWSYDAGCQNYYVPDVNETELEGGSGSAGTGIGGGGYGGAAGAAPLPNPTSVLTVTNAPIPVTNIADYIRCLVQSAVNGSATAFNVMVCVNQPDPGTRDTWTVQSPFSNQSFYPVKVGHTFLVLSETTAAGNITRNFGFYPTTFVTPVSPSSPGQIGDDENHAYNVSAQIAVGPSQFIDILGYIYQNMQNGINYNLNSLNCTSFVLNALSEGDIDLPRTTGSWFGGSGNDPGDLGQDLRTMILPSGMTLSTNPIPHPNQGSCN